MKKFNIDWIEKQPGKFYSEIIEKNLLEVIKSLYKANSRFITATCFQNSAGNIFIFYHFELKKKIYTLRTQVKNNVSLSITSIYPAASWAEREIAELYGIKFLNKKTKPLLLTPNIKTPFLKNS